ncbi:MAG TPA: hypothetical protein V6C96_03625 [Vampirovibrionales bacterium]
MPINPTQQMAVPSYANGYPQPAYAIGANNPAMGAQGASPSFTPPPGLGLPSSSQIAVAPSVYPSQAQALSPQYGMPSQQPSQALPQNIPPEVLAALQQQQAISGAMPNTGFQMPHLPNGLHVPEVVTHNPIARSVSNFFNALPGWLKWTLGIAGTTLAGYATYKTGVHVKNNAGRWTRDAGRMMKKAPMGNKELKATMYEMKDSRFDMNESRQAHRISQEAYDVAVKEQYRNTHKAWKWVRQNVPGMRPKHLQELETKLGQTHGDFLKAKVHHHVALLDNQAVATKLMVEKREARLKDLRQKLEQAQTKLSNKQRSIKEGESYAATIRILEDKIHNESIGLAQARVIAIEANQLADRGIKPDDIIVTRKGRTLLSKFVDAPTYFQNIYYPHDTFKHSTNGLTRHSNSPFLKTKNIKEDGGYQLQQSKGVWPFSTPSHLRPAIYVAPNQPENQAA